MASRYVDPKTGRTHIAVKAANGKRRPIRFGVLSAEDAEEAERRLAKIELLHRRGEKLDAMTKAWLTLLEPEHYDRIARTGLLGTGEAADAEYRRTAKGDPKASKRSRHTMAPVVDHKGVTHRHGTLGALVARWRETVDVAPGTLVNYDQHNAMLMRYFGKDKLVAELIPADADSVRKWAVEKGSAKGKAQSRATVSRAIKTWKAVFDFAVRLRWVTRDADADLTEAISPFDHLQAEGEFNEERNYYVTSRLVDHLIDDETDLEFKAILALCRYATFRGPSELSRLTWQDVDFERNVIHVTAPKTKRHRGGMRRTAPLEGRALEALEALYDAAPEGATEVLPRMGGADSSYHTQRLGRLCRRIGLGVWPKPWMNMRACCETDWQTAGKSMFETAAWMGHSPAVALQHYNRVAKDRIVDLPEALRAAEAPSSKGAKRSAKRSAVECRKR